MSASPSPSASTKACTISSRRYPKMPGRRFLTGWTVPLLWPSPPSRVSPTPHRCGSSSGADHARLPTGSLRPTAIKGFITDRDGWNWRLTIAATPRSRTRYATSSTASGEPPPLGPLRRQRRLAQVILARWTARIGLGEQIVTTKTLRRRFFALAGRITRSARRLTLHLQRGTGKPSSVAPWPGCEPFHSQPDGQPAADSTSPANSRHPGPREFPAGIREHPSSRRRP